MLHAKSRSTLPKDQPVAGKVLRDFAAISESAKAAKSGRTEANDTLIASSGSLPQKKE
jgi:hypothetical protein